MRLSSLVAFVGLACIANAAPAMHDYDLDDALKALSYRDPTDRYDKHYYRLGEKSSGEGTILSFLKIFKVFISVLLVDVFCLKAKAMAAVDLLRLNRSVKVRMVQEIHMVN